MSKRYYWLKLKEDFFNDPDIKLIKSMQNGKDYVILYLQLQLLSLKTEGILRHKDVIPYTPEMLSTLTDSNIDIVRAAINVFRQLDMVEIWDDGTIYMSELQKLIGNETESAARVRKHREQKKLALQCNEDVIKSNTEIEREKELDIELDIDTDTETDKSLAVPFEQIKDLFNSVCKSFSDIRTISAKRKTHIKARWIQHGQRIEVFEELFTKAEASDFLKGKNNRDWKADFDWLMNENNMAKVLEDRYKNKGGDSGSNSADNSKNQSTGKYAQFDTSHLTYN